MNRHTFLKGNLRKLALVVLSLVLAFSCLGLFVNAFDVTASSKQNVSVVSDDFTTTFVAGGLNLKSKQSGTLVEGKGFSFGTQSGNFDMEFKVKSARDYTPGTNAIYSHTLKDAQAASMWAFGDEFNPYNDVKRIAIKFTSNTNPNAWFKLFIQGTPIKGGENAHITTAWVQVNGDTTFIYGQDYADVIYGYGLRGGAYSDKSGADVLDYKFTNMWGTSFSNYKCSTEGIISDSLNHTIKFDKDTGNVYVNNPNTTYNASSSTCTQLVRNVVTNEGYTDNGAAEYSYTVASLSLSDFANGYDVSFEIVDMTDNNAVGNTANVTNYCWSAANVYQAISEKYDRYADMTIYTLNGVAVSDFCFMFVWKIYSFCSPQKNLL